MKNEIYEKLKELFNLTKTVEKFEDAYLSDGSCLRGDLKVGGKLQLVSSDGNVTEVTDGEYELKDGRKVVIKQGVVDSINEAPVASETTEEPMAVEAPAEIAPAATEVAPIEDTPTIDEVESMLPQIVADLADRVGALEAALASAKTANEAMSATIAKLSKEPAAEPIKRTATADSFSSTEIKDDYFSKISELSRFRK